MLRWASSRSIENGYLKTDAQRAADRIHRRARPIRPRAVLAGRAESGSAHISSRPPTNLPRAPCNEAVEMVDHERALGRPASRAALLNEITADPTWAAHFCFLYGLS